MSIVRTFGDEIARPSCFGFGAFDIPSTGCPLLRGDRRSGRFQWLEFLDVLGMPYTKEECARCGGLGRIQRERKLLFGLPFSTRLIG